MENTRKNKMIWYLLGMLVMSILLVGCGNLGTDGGADNTEDTQNLLEGTAGLFLILEHNTADDVLTLYSYESGEECSYRYDIETKFYDKYGNNEPMERFSVGRVVELDAKSPEGYLTGVHISDEIWEQKNVVRFSMDMEKGVFTIGDANYSIKNNVMVFSNTQQIELNDLWEEDVLNVVGQGTRILSIDVVKGHGTLKVVNTSLFNDSLLNLGDMRYEKVQEGLTIKVPEGTYALTVAKDGWGSTTEITINRGETTEIDLDTIKGDGPKKGKISFRINVEDVKVYIDYKEIDHTQPVEVVYGTHVLQISATGYTSWKGKIVVGAEESIIEIELEEDDSGAEKDTEEDSKKETEKESEATNT